jgi:8-oxo-dGTP pyrophosphatase MutT (NUDIX family)
LSDDYIALARHILAGHEPRTIDAPGTLDAAVLVLLYHDAGREQVLLTVRTDKVEHHKGQISFPGGGRHGADEDLETTALRETWEEVGVHPDHVEIIGRLDEMVTISNFRVRPYVGVLTKVPYEFVPQEFEVAQVLEVPVRHLLDPANKVHEPRTLPNGAIVGMPAYWYGEHRIWGATARMLETFLSLLEQDERDA